MDWKLVLKIVTGIVIVPIALLANVLWPWWEHASLPMKVLTAVVVFPIAGFAYATSFWWNEF